VLHNGVVGNKFSSVLPEVYAGHPLRIERYTQYDQMDMDSEVNAALDTIADFCTQKDDNTGEIFEIVYNGSQSDTEVEILKTCLHQWNKINEFNRRFWRIFRSTLKYGDQFFIRDPETLKWYWVEQAMVEKILVNEANGKEPEAYLVRNLNLNATNLTATQSQQYGNNIQGIGSNSLNQYGGVGAWGAVGGPSRMGPVTNPNGRYASDSNQLLTAVDATHMVHLSLSEGLDANWPFGVSILESVFKTFRQKELLEDAVIIYRIIRAPERRIFYIDTGQMPAHKAGAYIEKVKNEIYQKRIPSRTGGASTLTTDAAYSPMCLDMTTRVPLEDGRTLSLVELEQEYRAGVNNCAFSCNPQTGAVVPGPITWAGVTRQNAEVICLHLDNGQSLICTPDHKIPVRGRGVVMAANLTTDDELFGFNKLNDQGTFVVRLDRIEQLPYRMDVGTITIDGNEDYHSLHNFAIEQQIIVQNSMIDDYFFATGESGRGSKVETLPGGENLGVIDDLRWWQNKLIRGLRVPSSYLPNGPDDGQQTYNDGRTGAAYIQEYRFATYCARLQQLIAPVFDKEFKLFVKQRGFNIDSSIFELAFTTPQHFSDFARVEKDAAMINVFQPLVELKWFSKRFLMRRYLGMTEEEITENEEKWRQENPDAIDAVGASEGGGGSAADMAADAAPGIDSMGLDDTGEEGEAEGGDQMDAGGGQEPKQAATGASPPGDMPQ
jgi:hypothetical protein